jgi:hypothetical protein
MDDCMDAPREVAQSPLHSFACTGQALVEFHARLPVGSSRRMDPC